jgi:hypothetical protein
MTGFYNREGACLLRGTDWIFIYTCTRVIQMNEFLECKICTLRAVHCSQRQVSRQHSAIRLPRAYEYKDSCLMAVTGLLKNKSPGICDYLAPINRHEHRNPFSIYNLHFIPILMEYPSNINKRVFKRHQTRELV